MLHVVRGMTIECCTWYVVLLLNVARGMSSTADCCTWYVVLLLNVARVTCVASAIVECVKVCGQE